VGHGPASDSEHWTVPLSLVATLQAVHLYTSCSDESTHIAKFPGVQLGC
jgi:hypothetical protein